MHCVGSFRPGSCADLTSSPRVGLLVVEIQRRVRRGSRWGAGRRPLLGLGTAGNAWCACRCARRRLRFVLVVIVVAGGGGGAIACDSADSWRGLRRGGHCGGLGAGDRFKKAHHRLLSSSHCLDNRGSGGMGKHLPFIVSHRQLVLALSMSDEAFGVPKAQLADEAHQDRLYWNRS